MEGLKSVLLRESMLKVKKPESDPVMAYHRAESRNYSVACYLFITGLKVIITSANHLSSRKARVNNFLSKFSNGQLTRAVEL